MKIKLSFKETLPQRQQPRKNGTSEAVAIHSPATETKQNYY
jgi:hypothetical protein